MSLVFTDQHHPNYSTTPRNGNPVNGNHLEICLSSPQKNGNCFCLGPGGLASALMRFAYPD